MPIWNRTNKKREFLRRILACTALLLPTLVVAVTAKDDWKPILDISLEDSSPVVPKDFHLSPDFQFNDSPQTDTDVV